MPDPRELIQQAREVSERETPITLDDKQPVGIDIVTQSFGLVTHNFGDAWTAHDYVTCRTLVPALADALEHELNNRLSLITVGIDARYAGENALIKQLASPAVQSVLDERTRQDAKWGEQNHDPFTYLAILTEEVGEFSQAALETHFGGKHGGLENMRKEAVHTAAVALAIVECLDRGKWRFPEVGE